MAPRERCVSARLKHRERFTPLLLARPSRTRRARTVSFPKPLQSLALGQRGNLERGGAQRKALLGHLEDDFYAVQRRLDRLGRRASQSASYQVVQHAARAGRGRRSGS